VLSCPPSLSVDISKKDNGISVNFKDKLPSVQTKKLLIKISTGVEKIFFGAESGSIKLKYFPEFPFSYKDDSEEERFGNAKECLDFVEFKQEIAKQYPDNERKKIAELALKYANEWAIISSQNCSEFKSSIRKNRRRLSKECNKFVYENIINSKEIEAKSIALSFILLYFVLPAIVNWIVKRFLDKLAN
jgi:hypothetical protein